MPSRIHAICNPVLLFHVAIHSPATLPPPARARARVAAAAARRHRRHLFYIRRRHHRSTNPRSGKAAPLIAGRAVGFMLHFLSPIKMQLRLFDKAPESRASIVPLSRPYIPRFHSFGPVGNAAAIILAERSLAVKCQRAPSVPSDANPTLDCSARKARARSRALARTRT